MGKARELRCRVCGSGGESAPCTSGAVCLVCWRLVPAKLRIAAVTAYRRRRHEPARHADATAGVLQWCMDQSARRGVQK